MVIRQIFRSRYLNDISVEKPGLDSHIPVKSLTFPNFPTAPSLISSSAEQLLPRLKKSCSHRRRYWDGADRPVCILMFCLIVTSQRQVQFPRVQGHGMDLILQYTLRGNQMKYIKQFERQVGTCPLSSCRDILGFIPIVHITCRDVMKYIYILAGIFQVAHQL